MILSSHKNTNEIVLVESGFVFKRSKFGVSKKILQERSFYRSLSKDRLKDVLHYFPKFYKYRVIGNKYNEIKMEYLKGYSSLDKILLSCESKHSLNEDFVEGLHTLLQKFSRIRQIDNKKDASLFDRFYVKRVTSRLKEMNANKELHRLNLAEKITVNGIKYNSLQQNYFNLMRNGLFLKILRKNQINSFFHGDFHYENILLGDDGVIKLVDPNGLSGGLISYDFGKLLHSSLGKCSVIQNNLFTLGGSKDEYNLSLNEPPKHKEFSDKINRFLKKNLSSLEYVQALFACWCHMISLIPHHIPNGKKQSIAFYLRALEIGELFFEELEGYSSWETLESNVVFDNKRMKIVEDKVLLPNDNVSYYTVWDTHKAVAVLAFDKKNRLLLKREYRHPVKKVIYDLPGGAVEDAEEVLHSAKRELEEETGYTSSEMRVLGSFYMDPGRANREIFIVVAKNIKRIKREDFKENDEFIDFDFFPISWIKQNIRRGVIKDASLIAGMTYLKF